MKRRRYTAKQLQQRLERAGWIRTIGGKHAIRMSKKGERPVTIPLCKGETLDVGLSTAILRQAGIDDG